MYRSRETRCASLLFVGALCNTKWDSQLSVLVNMRNHCLDGRYLSSEKLDVGICCVFFFLRLDWGHSVHCGASWFLCSLNRSLSNSYMPCVCVSIMQEWDHIAMRRCCMVVLMVITQEPGGLCHICGTLFKKRTCERTPSCLKIFISVKCCSRFD